MKARKIENAMAFALNVTLNEWEKNGRNDR